MAEQYSWAHQRFLFPVYPPNADQRKTVRSVTFSQEVIDTLSSFYPLEGPITGPLFGKREGHHRIVQFSATDCYEPLGGIVFLLKADYIVGYVDALRQALSPELDWIGHWIALPDRLGNAREIEHYVRLARKEWVIDAYQILVFVHPTPKVAAVPRLFNGMTRHISTKTQPINLTTFVDTTAWPSFNEVNALD